MTNTAVVHQFRPAAELVVSRNREEALRAMVPRLLELAERVCHVEPRPKGMRPATYVFAPGLGLRSFRNSHDLANLYVDVHATATGERLFSAWLNCPPDAPGKYMDGKVHIMSWKRGWEGALVDVRRMPQ